MISFETVVERAFTGPICTERDFGLDIFVPNLRKVIEKYDIKYDPQHPVPADDALADRVWAAAIEFLCETGVYCLDTERRILFTREEVEVALPTDYIPQHNPSVQGRITALFFLASNTNLKYCPSLLLTKIQMSAFVLGSPR